VALQKVPSLLNAEAAALKRIAKLERRDVVRKASKESNAKAQKNRDREVAKNQRKVAEEHERDLGSSDSFTEDESEGSDSDALDVSADEKHVEPEPEPVPAARRRRRSVDEVPAAAAPARRSREPEGRRSAAAPAQRLPAPPGPPAFTAEEQARLNAWTTISFSEWCFKERYDMQALRMLIARGAPIPYVAPPDWYVGPDERKAPATQPTPRVAQPATRVHAPPHVPASSSLEEKDLRNVLANHGIDDLRARVPVLRHAPAQEMEVEMQADLIDPEDSEDSDMSVTPAVSSIHIQ